MRIIAELPNPNCKISIFSMNKKFIIKFEQGSFEQTFKIAEMDVTDGVNGVFQLLDDTFIEEVLLNFKNMLSSFKDTYNRHEY